MTSIITAVFKATIGLLVNKGRDVAAERLKEGDVSDQKIRGLIVREIEDIKSKLDGLVRKDLLASICFFKEGIELLYEVFERARSRSEYGAVRVQAVAGTASTLAKEMKKMEVTSLDESTTRALDKAKKRFEEARREATKAFANEAMKLSDRILAMQYRIMATVLESIDNPEDALSACRVCIEELHCLPAVQKSFNVELKQGFWARFSKDERWEIISTVCEVNRVIYDVTQMVARGGELFMLPCVDTGEEKLDPLRDERVRKVLQKVGMEHYCVQWSFGQREGEEEHKLKAPCGITTNTNGQFLIADGNPVKVFDSNGNFLRSLNPKTDDPDTKLIIRGVATDMENNTYVLVVLEQPCHAWAVGYVGYDGEVRVFNNTADLQHKFPVGGRIVQITDCVSRLTVSGSKVLVVIPRRYQGKDVVHVYQQDGVFLCSFGDGLFKRATDITAANDGFVMVLDSDDSCVHLFTVEGQQLSKFNINIARVYYCHIACHPAGEHFVVGGYERGTERLRVAIFTTKGEFVRRIQLDEEKVHLFEFFGGITVTMNGHIAVAFKDLYRNSKVAVV